jgi:DNA mismatch repair protein MutS2
VLEKAREQAGQEADNLRQEVDEVRRALARARQPLEALKPVQQRVEEITTTVQQAVAREDAPQAEGLPLRLGEKVRVRSIRMEGVITAIGESDVEVQVGNLRVRARLGDLQRRGEPDEPRAEGALASGKTTLTAAASGAKGASKASQTATPYYPSPGMEIDLRGQRAEDAVDALERYLEAAYLAGLPFVRIIHGKGTGRLRQVIRESLGASPHVKSHGPGLEQEGGDGVTVAKLHID